MFPTCNFHPSRVPFRPALLLGLLLPGALLTSACSRGEEREFLGPPDTRPVDRTVAQLVVVPRVGTLQQGERMNFAAFGRSASGDSMGVQVTWSASGGSVSGTGAFTAVAPGSYWVVARSVTQAEKADSANVVVVGPNNPITRVDVTPASVGMRVGQSRQFVAAAYHQDGSRAAVPIFWTASGGNIDAAGVYTADRPGDQQVIAVVGAGLADTALVRVSTVPVLTVFQLDPADDSLPQGDSRQYTVTAAWSDGSTAPPRVDFSTTGGLIDSTGVFTAAAAPGDYLVFAKERGGTREASSRVRIETDRIVGIDVSPPSVLLAPGATFRFSAGARTRNGGSSGVNVNWSATGGTITTNGSYTAGSVAGTYRVIATESGGTLADTAFVTISAPSATLTQLVLNPSAVTVAAGAAQQFVVAGSWSDGSSATPSVAWSATGGTITAGGDYRAGSVPGTYRVIARHAGGTLADTSVVTVTGPRLTALVLTPATASVTAGSTQQFAVAASWSDGSSALPPLVFTATGGTVSAAGLFTAGTATGTFRVIVRDQAATMADTSFVTVTPPAPVLQGIDIIPGGAELASGAMQQFYVQGIWTNGGSAVPAVTWSATGGAITTGGRFTAGSTPGTFRVIAREPVTGHADTALVTVLPPPPVLTGIRLTPGSATVQPGATQQFAVDGIWTNGGSGAPAVSWSATGGSMSAGGLFTAGPTPGTYRVIAHQAGGSLADTAVVTVAQAAPVLTGIVVSPDSATVAVGGGLQFAAAGQWTNGGAGAPAVTWTATGGSITPAGHFTAGGTPGTFRVVATQTGGTLADTAAVFVDAGAPVLTSLRIVPDSVNLQTGMAYEFRAQATWSNGTTTLPPLDWSAGGGAVNGNGRYVAGTTPGVYQVIARHQGGTRADTAQVRLLAPTVTQVILSPSSATVPVGGTQQFTATAVWSDGVSRPVAVTYTATGGSISVNGLFTAGQVAGVATVIAACGCGVSDTTNVTVTPPSGNPTLTSLLISPAGVSLVPSATQQFAVTARWSDGSTTVPPLTWSASGGTVSGAGFFTAPAAPGAYRVVVAHQGGTLADTAAVTVIQSSPGGPDFPNLPTGFQLISDVTWDNAGKLPPASLPYDGRRWARLGGQARLSIGSAGAAGCPAGPYGDEVLRGFVPRHFNISNGQPVGIGPWSMEMQFTQNADRFNSIYQVIWTATPPTFDEGLNVGHKWSWFLGPPSGSRTNHFWATYDIAPATIADVRPRFVTQFNGNWVANGQQFTAPANSAMPHGQWHKVEMLLRGGTPGGNDGSFEMWVNGNKAIDIRNAAIQPPDANGNQQGFRGVRWNPTWGAVELQPIDTYICVARWAVYVGQPLP
jgi:hypothetical protein